MSNLFGEARIAVLPDTAGFRAELIAQIEAAQAGVVATVPVAAVGAATATAEVEALTVAIQELTAALTEDAVASEADAAAQRVLGASAAKATGEQAALAAATRKHTQQLGQLERGAAATGLSLFGLRGATLAASGGFLAGAVGATIFAKGVQEASDQTEQLNKTREVFGQFSKEVEDFAKTAAESFGESTASALELVSTFGALLRPIGFTQKAAVEESLALTKLGADLASFFNTSVADALAAIQSGLVGQVRPLRRYGVELSAARVNALALADSGKDVASSLTDQEKVAARIKVIFRDTSIAQGDFARTSGEFANQTRILTAQVSNLSGELGRLAIPVLTVVLRTMTTTIGVANTLTGALAGVAKEFLDVGDAIRRIPKGKIPLPEPPKQDEGGVGSFFRGVTGDILGFQEKVKEIPGLFARTSGDIQTESQKTAAAVQKIFESAKQTDSIAKFNGDMSNLIQTLRAGTPEQQKSAEQLQRLADAVAILGHLPGPAEFAALMKQLGITIDTTDASTERLTSGMAGLRAVLDEASGAAANLNAQLLGLNQSQITGQLQAQKTAVARAQAFGGTGLVELQQELARIDKILNSAKGKRTRGPALEGLFVERKAVVAEINSITKGTVSAIQDATRQGLKNQAIATQAFIDSFSPKQQRLQNKLTSAQLFGDTRAQIAANKRILAADTAEIHALQAYIHQKHLHGDALRAAVAEIKRLQQEQFNLRNTIAQLRAERQQANIDARQTHLEAMLSIAETTASTRDDARAQRALIAFDNAQIKRILGIKHRRKLTQDEKAQLDAYRVDLAQRTQALKDLTAEQKKGADTSKAQFAFLQTQAGFAANLLGNLIPGGATGGLVGGTTGTAAGTTPLRQVAGGFEQPRGANAAQSVSARSATAPSGPSRTGQARQTHLLNQILHVLNNIYRGTGHPEAHHRRRTNPSAMDLDNHH